MSAASGFYIGLLIIGIVLLICYYKTGRLFRCMFFTALTGICALGIVCLLGKVIGSPLSMTPLTLSISGILGIPGVVAMLLLNLL